MALNQLLKPRICELGKIKIGGKGEARQSRGGGTWRMPVKYDHFVVTTLNRTKDGDLMIDEDLMAHLRESGRADDDGRIRRLPIHLLSNEIDDVLQASYVWYGGKTVGARSDGETVTWFHDYRNGKKLVDPYEEPWDEKMLSYTDSKNRPLFKMHATFNCVIASQQSRWGGVYKFRTTSRITADQLYGSLLHLQQLTSGVLAGMPLQLVVRPMQVSPQGKPTTVYVVHVELRGTDLMAIQDEALRIAQHQAQHAKQIQQSRQEYRRLLTGPGEETDPEEIGDIEDEFCPVYGPEDDAPSENGGGRQNAKPVKPGPNRLRDLIDARDDDAEPQEPAEPVTVPTDNEDANETHGEAPNDEDVI